MEIIKDNVKFSKVEKTQIKDLKEFMKSAFDVKSWNHLREQAKEIWPNKIISAVDGLRKWSIEYNKQTKTKICLGISFE